MGFFSPKSFWQFFIKTSSALLWVQIWRLNWILNLFHWAEPLPCLSNFTNVFSKGPDSKCFCSLGYLISVTNRQLCSCHTKAAEDKAQMNGCDRVPKRYSTTVAMGRIWSPDCSVLTFELYHSWILDALSRHYLDLWWLFLSTWLG